MEQNNSKLLLHLNDKCLTFFFFFTFFPPEVIVLQNFNVCWNPGQSNNTCSHGGWVSKRTDVKMTFIVPSDQKEIHSCVNSIIKVTKFVIFSLFIFTNLHLWIWNLALMINRYITTLFEVIFMFRQAKQKVFPE